MEETAKMESHMSSAAAFVEGGIQDACDDSCSICLEAFCDSDPSTVTSCKHEYHLQCILEWCQRSSQCPMCWQPISLKDPTSQELLEAVEQERNLRVNRSRTTTIFRHPMLGDFELQHLPVGADDAELEERIIQHLAAAAAMGRTHRIARREGQRVRGGAHGRPQFLVFSAHQTSPPSSASSGGSGSAPSISSQSGEGGVPIPTIVSASPLPPLAASTGEDSPSPLANLGPADHASATNTLTPTNTSPSANSTGLPANRASGQSTPVSNDRAGPSDLHSFSESLKSRFQAVSMRYKESITKSTRGWRERLFSRNSAIADIGSEVRSEVSAGIAAVSRMMERLDTSNNNNSNNDNNNSNNDDNNNNNNSANAIHNTINDAGNSTSTGTTEIGGSERVVVVAPRDATIEIAAGSSTCVVSSESK